MESILLKAFQVIPRAIPAENRSSPACDRVQLIKPCVHTCVQITYVGQAL